jgi:hypothetical protein
MFGDREGVLIPIQAAPEPFGIVEGSIIEKFMIQHKLLLDPAIKFRKGLASLGLQELEEIIQSEGYSTSASLVR